MHGQKKGNPLERVARNKKTGRFQKLRKNNMPASKVSKIKAIKRTIREKASKPVSEMSAREWYDYSRNMTVAKKHRENKKLSSKTQQQLSNDMASWH